MENTENPLEKMAKDLAEVRAKYDLPKQMGLIPDRIEILIDRKGLDAFKVNYSEYFNYLPKDILSQALLDTVNMLTQWGVKSETINILENGVHTVFSGNFSILIQPLSEILMQHYNIEKDFDGIFKSLKVGINAFLNMMEFRYVLNNETEKEYLKIRDEYNKKTFENPNIIFEINKIMEKFKSSIMEYSNQL